MNIEVRTLQIKKTSWTADVVDQYIKKISFYSSVQFKPIKSEKDFLKNITEKDFVLICDENGKQLESRAFATQLQNILESGKKNLFVLIGGPFGLPNEVKSRADFNLALSRLVFNQEIALAVLMEQLFRAFTINANHPYHND